MPGYHLVCDDIWIPLGEALLISRFQPPWNVLLDGFGIHKPGKGRKKQVTSKWDTLHPGRSLAMGLPPNPMSQDAITNLVVDFFQASRSQPSPPRRRLSKRKRKRKTTSSGDQRRSIRPTGTGGVTILFVFGGRAAWCDGGTTQTAPHRNTQYL